MLTYLNFNEIDNINNISKNCEVTKGRLNAQWGKLAQGDEQDDFCNKYYLKRLVINVILKTGRVTLRLVAALAKHLEKNPYWLICHSGTDFNSDDFNEYSDELLHKFLLEHRYDSDKPPKTVEPVVSEVVSSEDSKRVDEEDNADTASVSTAQDSGDKSEKSDEQRARKKQVAHENPYIVTLRERIEQRLIEISSDELQKIESISEKDAVDLLKSLYLRSGYDEEISRISTIVKLAMLL